MNPAWRIVPDFPAYEVSASGRVRSVATQYVLTPRKGIVALSLDGKAHRCAVRDLVAAAWTEKPGAPDRAEPMQHVAEALDAGSQDGQQPPLGDMLGGMLGQSSAAPAASAELLDLAGEYDCLTEEITRLTVEAEIGIRTANRQDALVDELMEDNSALKQQIARMKSVPAGDLVTENARLRGVVAELEAELALYRASACI